MAKVYGFYKLLGDTNVCLITNLMQLNYDKCYTLCIQVF